jgi:hypothetical protein
MTGREALRGIINDPDLEFIGVLARREEKAIEDMARLLRAGINVVTISTIPMVYSPAAPPAWVYTMPDEPGDSWPPGHLTRSKRCATPAQECTVHSTWW